VSKNVAAAMWLPPFAEETQLRGFSRLAEAKDYAPLSGIGLLASSDALKKNPTKGLSVIRAVLQTMVYMRDPKNHRELVDYVLKMNLFGIKFWMQLAIYISQDIKLLVLLKDLSRDML